MDDFCAEGSDFAEVCVDGYPDFVAVCDYDFPPGTFEGTNYLDFCEIDYDTACAEFPELCDDTGAITTDLCGVYPEKCDSNSDEYNPCAADLYACISEEDFDLCMSFPELCGF